MMGQTNPLPDVLDSWSSKIWQYYLVILQEVDDHHEALWVSIQAVASIRQSADNRMVSKIL